MANIPLRKKAPGATALLIVDMINDLQLEEGRRMAIETLPVSNIIAKLRTAATKSGVPVVYVNDNYGLWHRDQVGIVDYCMRPNSNGKDIVRKLRPRKRDYFVVKPHFSGFYATNLPVLLPRLGVSRLILTGIAADVCVLFTAADAHMRDYELWLPRDATAGTRPERKAWVIDMLENHMKAETAPASDMPLQDWLDRHQG
jgi:nicotinamidase-related amidase